MPIPVSGDNSATYYLNLFKEKLRHAYHEREVFFIFRNILSDAFAHPFHLTQNIQDIRFSESEILRILSILSALESNQPIQHILKTSHFFGLKLWVNEHVLIPRPETEYLMHLVQKRLPFMPSRILDICTGSGCMALAAKHIYPNAEVLAWEKSNEALVVAKKNADNLSLSIKFREMDTMQMPMLEEPVDVILSNPPYIPESESHTMDAHVLNFEPKMALFVPDKHPLVFYEKILAWALNNLSQKGHLFFEIHPAFDRELLNLARTFGFFAEILNDLDGRARYLHGQWKT